MSGMLSLRSPFERLRVSGKERVPLRERALDANGTGHGLARRAKGDHEAVAQGLDLVAAVLLHLPPHQLPLNAQYLLRGFVAPTGRQVSGADNVRKQDGDRAFRQL